MTSIKDRLAEEIARRRAERWGGDSVADLLEDALREIVRLETRVAYLESDARLSEIERLVRGKLSDHPEPLVMEATLYAASLCVPGDWDEQQILAFAEQEVPSGLSYGWRLRSHGFPCMDRSGAQHATVSV